MGGVFDNEKYQDALSISSLVTDIGILPRGDQTEIGEKGITLSGGQKQRVSLARAVYSNREICLLDDPLSALDVHVGRECFERLICERLRDRLAILVTHDWHLLNHADRIVFVDESGVTSGTSVEEMKEKSVEFREMMIPVVEEESGSDGGGSGGNNGGDTTTTMAVEADKVVMASVTPIEPSDIVVAEADKNQDKNPDIDQDKNKKSEKLTLTEVRQRGSVKTATITHYFSLFFHWTNSWSTVVLILTLMGCAEACNILTNWWLAQWSVSSERGEAPPDTFPFWLGIYGVFLIGSLLLYFLSQLMLSIGAVAAATRLHDGLLYSLLGAPMSWFERTPTGRTLSRASKDVDEADTLLRQSLGSMFSCLCETGGVLVLVTVVTKGYMAVALVPVIGCYYIVLQYYRHCSRELKRIESTTKSPIFSHFAETLNGLECLRAFELEQIFLKKHVLSLDTNHRAFFLTNAANRWLSMRLELVGGFLTLITTVLLILTSTTEEAAVAGLALIYMTQLLNELNWGVRMVSETEVRMNAVERLLEYSNLPQERERHSDGDKLLVARPWPSVGNIQFDNVQLRYRPTLPLALRGINLDIPGGSRVGICGRTGSGKSSLFVALFRIVELNQGSIIIDGVDVSKIGLSTLRESVAIIPQHPNLFVGTVRRNLDPFESFEDDELWSVLHDCGLEEMIRARQGQLSADVAEGGSNFSLGEKQLICVARALLRKPKLLLLDEATASIDAATDSMIQAMVRRVFAGTTQLTIAHRLNTIADSDIVVVLDDGRVAEMDSPEKLLQDPSSQYSAMVRAAAANSSGGHRGGAE